MPQKQLDDQAIFELARKIDSPQARAACVRQMCGRDLAMEQRVNALLAAFDQSGSFLELPPSEWLLGETSLAPVTEGTGSQIGPYKLLQQIGEGGMGAVYMAEQIEPVERRVALKIIKPGMDTKAVIARFEAERQALAMMDHPGIAKVLDVGTTNSGRPYFVMELVRGVPITQYCDEHQLTPRQRLELFLPVCQAVQHAHQKGIIHRDIKPSNVLVAEYDDRPVTKIIDFGLAKAMEKRLTAKTMFTEFGQIVGTPDYMSPEQAKLNQMDIDTRSDIYSLGVLLYELLSGNTPFDRERMRSAAFDELLRIIREEEPPKPSLRLSTVDTLPSIAANRHITPAELTRQLSGELDWIVMKTLEKDRSRRYETANGLAADIKRYLNDEPVHACPPSTAYRLRKLARRNKVALVTTSLVSIALLLGTGVSISQAVRANQEAKIANAQAQRAEENLRLAMVAVNEMYTEVAESSRTTPRSQGSRKRVLEKALDYYLAFAKINSSITLKHETAMAWRRVGEIYHRFEQNDKSQEALLTAIEMLQGLVNQAPLNPRYRQDLASTYWFLSKPLDVTSQFEDGEEFCRMAIQIQTQLVEEFPLELEHSAALAVSYHQLGHMQKDSHEAFLAFTASRELFTDLKRAEPKNSFYSGQLAHDHHHLGRLLYDAGKTKEAEENYRTSIELIGEASGPSDADVIGSHHAILGGAYRSWGVLLRDSERFPEAATAHGDAVRLFSVLAEDFPTVNYYQSQLGLSQIELGETLLLVDRDAEAKDAFEAAYRIFAKLEKDFPGNPSYRQRRDVANTWINREELDEEPAVSK